MRLVFPNGLESAWEQVVILRTWMPEYLGDAQMVTDSLKELVAWWPEELSLGTKAAIRSDTLGSGTEQSPALKSEEKALGMLGPFPGRASFLFQ